MKLIELKASYMKLTKNGDGEIDYEEFLHALHPVLNEMGNSEVARARSRGYTFSPSKYQTYFDKAKKKRSN